ncbi:unnamed protein product [Mytilus edulis]|uniref:Uncharacterized protein n=1 Tax=Mytilus edulis TaxID=6550 RepID=A0A8S3Q0W9_MYTED|nr:unnamed protein product [Mytilus edulis]
MIILSNRTGEMEKQNLRIVFARGTSIEKLANISVVLRYHINDHLSNWFKPFYLQGEEISKFMKISIKNISIFYETKIELDYRTDMCTGTVNVTCSYGNHTVLITQLVDACTDSSETSNTTVQIIIATLAGCMLVGGCLAVYCYWKLKQTRFPAPIVQFNAIPQSI